MNSISRKCDNGCDPSTFCLTVKCIHCKKEVCYRCVGYQTGHHFVSHNYCHQCCSLLREGEIKIDDHVLLSEQNIVYKPCRHSIATLQLLPDSVTNELRGGVINPDYANFRTSKAQVISMIHPFTKEEITEDSSYDSSFIYKIGEIVQTTFDNNINKVYASGIHYFKTEETAINCYVRQGNKPPDGTWRGWYASGQMEYEGTYKNGKLDGIWKTWYESGQTKSEETYKDRKLDGISKSWYKGGQLKSEGTYKNEEKDGTWRKWYEGGHEESEETYKNGTLDGIWRWWFENGWYEGEKDGTWRGWNGNGRLGSEGTYKNGEKDGTWRWWYKSGQLGSEETYKMEKQME